MATLYLLDTDHCIAYLKPKSRQHASVAARIQRTPAQELRISTFTAMELAEGPHHAPTSTARQITLDGNARLLASVTRAEITDAVVQEFGRIRAELRKAGQMIGAMDIGIAATALAHGLILVTHNTKDFGRIAGLSLEDWSI